MIDQEKGEGGREGGREKGEREGGRGGRVVRDRGRTGVNHLVTMVSLS